jgi:8-oxo-dGTP pyrophosphatase MutT (NUDIX family)
MGYVEELRKLVGSRKLIMPGVRAVIRDEAGAVLLQLRGDFRIWGYPAGSVELDESALDALRREVREETNLTVVKARPFAIYSNPKYGTSYPNGDQIQPYSIGFLVDEWTGTISPDGDESLDLRFFPLEALPPPERIVNAHRMMIGHLREFLETGEIVVD